LMDKFIQDKAISNNIYRASMHHLCHIPHIIEQCSSLRNISARSLEREIGNYKKKMRARVNVDANAINVFERITRYKFLETTGMIDFSTLYNRNPEYKRRGFVEHPAATNDFLGSQYPQLWEPFSSPVFLASSSSSTSPSPMIEGLIPAAKFVKALSAYKKRFLGVSRNAEIDLDLRKPMMPVAKLWSNGHILTSSIFKEKSKAATRGGEFVMFESNVKKRLNQRIQSVAHWFIGKVLFYFEYDLQLALNEGETSCGSLYAVVEVMKNHRTSPYSNNIPLVQPFRDSEVKKFAVVNVADIVSTVGLLQKTDLLNRRIQTSNWFYVISPSTAFDENMASYCGHLGDLL
ncbi:hypothetical protein, partial, partial [Parasitella parasitica]